MSIESKDNAIDFSRLGPVEQAAWDAYAAAAITGRLAGRDGVASPIIAATKASEIADAMLLERMKRF